MSIKAKVNLYGSGDVDVEYLDFETTKESDWTYCKLEDGNQIAVKSVLTKVIKSPTPDAATKDPVYFVMTTNVIRLIPTGKEK